MPQISANDAQIVAVFVECIFHGIYLVTFAASLRNIANSRPDMSWASRFYHHRVMLAIILSIFAISTSNLALGFVRVLELIHHVKQLGQEWINTFKPLGVQVETMIADCVLIYRCWIVYDKMRRVLILPFVLYVAIVVCTVFATILQAGVEVEKTPHANTVRLLQVWFIFWVSTITLNIYATSMIVLRIWRVESQSRGRNTLAPLYVTPHPSRLQTAMKAIIESGLLYTVTSILTFISITAGSNSYFITSAIGIQTTGIAFNLILIRVNPTSGECTVMEQAPSTIIGFAPGVTSSVHILTNQPCRGVPTEQLGINSKVVINSIPNAGDVENK